MLKFLTVVTRKQLAEKRITPNCQLCAVIYSGTDPEWGAAESEALI